MEKVDTLVFDKSGTLTEGRPKLVSVLSNGGFSPKKVLQFAASLEQSSEHPLAASILNGAKERSITPFLEVQNFHYVTGKGLVGLVSGKKTVLGNVKLLD